MSLQEIHDLHKRHLHDTTAFSVVIARSALKRVILIAYEWRLLSIRRTDRLMVALGLEGA